MTCDRYLDAVPWPGLLVCLLAGFSLGYLTARLVDRIRTEDR